MPFSRRCQDGIFYFISRLNRAGISLNRLSAGRGSNRGGCRNHLACVVDAAANKVCLLQDGNGPAEKSRQKREFARRREMRESTNGVARAEATQMLIYSPGGVVQRYKSRSFAKQAP